MQIQNNNLYAFLLMRISENVVWNGRSTQILYTNDDYTFFLPLFSQCIHDIYIDV